MGFLSRMFIPRGVRRSMHPARTSKSALTPKSVKRARRAMHPISNATYSLERSLTTKSRRRLPAPTMLDTPRRRGTRKEWLALVTVLIVIIIVGYVTHI